MEVPYSPFDRRIFIEGAPRQAVPLRTILQGSQEALDAALVTQMQQIPPGYSYSITEGDPYSVLQQPITASDLIEACRADGDDLGDVSARKMIAEARYGGIFTIADAATCGSRAFKEASNGSQEQKLQRLETYTLYMAGCAIASELPGPKDLARYYEDLSDASPVTVVPRGSDYRYSDIVGPTTAQVTLGQLYRPVRFLRRVFPDMNLETEGRDRLLRDYLHMLPCNRGSEEVVLDFVLQHIEPTLEAFAREQKIMRQDLQIRAITDAISY